MSLHRIQRAPARDTTSKRDSLMREHERTLSRGLNGDSTNSPRALYRRFTYRRFTYRRFIYRRLTYRRFILPSPYLPSFHSTVALPTVRVQGAHRDSAREP